MRWLTSASVVCVAAALIAAACGSTDQRNRARVGGGAGGQAEAGRPMAPSEEGGATAAPVGGIANGGALTGGEPALGGAAPTAGDAALGGAAPTAGDAALGGAGAAPAATVVDLDFDSTLPTNVDPGTSTLTPSEGFADLGPEGNKFGEGFLRGPTGAVITVTLSDLPPHTTLSLSMLFAAIDSLDGTGSFPAGDFFKITLDDVVIFRESFANALPDQIQSYDPPPGVTLARHVDLGFGGPGGYYTDSAYDFGQEPRLQNLPHTASSAVLLFNLEGEGVQDISDESWAIDNVRVTVD